MDDVYVKDESATGTASYRDAHVYSAFDPPASSVQPQPKTISKPEPETSYRSSYLEQLVSQSQISVEQLEKGVKIGVQLLDSLKDPLNAARGARDTQAAAHWLETIQQLQHKAKPTQTVVGVVGNTGAGKSSVINALLDEERLVPTNGMRACTASAIEISYNYSGHPEQLYRAEIDFIAPEDWAAELKTLLDDLLDGSGQVSRDCTNSDTEAGLAYAKIKAVYPHKTKEVIANSNPAYMAQEPAVHTVLGSVKRLAAPDASTLFSALQQYVDSREKVTGQDVRMEYWPLIKVVRIYCKAAALSTGAIVVDLPGVHDSNAARAAVAANYMKCCTGIWITAAIQRAVDDKTAKKLLGDSFKRQLKYDGTYSAVTFICTKTDDLLESEVIDSLNLEAEIGHKLAHVDDLREEQRQLNRQIASLKDEKYAIHNQMEELDSETDTWEALSEKLRDGETVYKPTPESARKRKRKTGPTSPRKRHASGHGSSDPESGYDSDASDKENSKLSRGGRDEICLPLTNDEIDAELAKAKAQKKNLRESKKIIDDQVSKGKKEVAALNTEEIAMLSEVKSCCIKGRNQYSRGAIKDDFSMGIKELDQEAAMDENEANFDPEEDLRDYAAVARSLPVFCVSARAYQKLSGRLRKDAVHIDGFLSMADTEIPALQEHTQKLTEAGRMSSCRQFLTDLLQLLNSMKLWASDDSRIVLSKKDQETNEPVVRAHLVSLKMYLHTAVDDCISAFYKTLDDQLYESFDRLIQSASASAVGTATSWGAHRSLGGLVWATYKATVRRSGVFAGASGPKDFNEELFDPVSKHLAGPWERTFQRRLPSALDKFAKDCKRVISEFHDGVVSGMRQPTTYSAGLDMLQQQLRARLTSLDAIPASLREKITNQQRDANRGFTPVVQQAMQYAYDVCIAERGGGSFARMKAHMCSHVEGARHTMFRQACDAVKCDLDAMCSHSEAAMQAVADEIFARLEQDYLAVLVGKEAEAQGALPCSEPMSRASLPDRLVEADCWFASLFPNDDHTTEPVVKVDENGVPGNAMARSEGLKAREHEYVDDITDDLFA